MRFCLSTIIPVHSVEDLPGSYPITPHP